MRAPLLLFAAALTLVLACGGEKPPSPDAVARLGGREIKYREFEQYLERNLGDSGRALPSEVLSQLFDQFLDEALLLQLADDRKVSEESDSRARLEKLLATSPPPQPSAAEQAAYYESHRSDFHRSERVHLRQILVEDKAEAEAARRELAAGADFAAVAQRRSKEPSAPEGGDQGILSRDDIPPELVGVIFALGPGQVSDIVTADYGFHLFQVLERFPASDLSLAEATPEIRSILERNLADGQLAKLTAEARARYRPVVYERNMPFNYVAAQNSQP